jgi:hypothetical protein
MGRMAWEIVKAFFIIAGILIVGFFALSFLVFAIPYPFGVIILWLEKRNETRRRRAFQNLLQNNPAVRELYENGLITGACLPEPEPSWLEKILHTPIFRKKTIDNDKEC